jgi:O-acetyl-ADP-ribose deacetylase (regulator of RNase III)
MQSRTANYLLNNTVFKVTYSNITHLSVDAIVSSDDNLLSMGGGVSRAIYNSGGETIRLDAQKHLPLNIGDVVVTSAGNLRSKYVFHAVTIDYSNMIYPSEESIRKATLKCMQLCDKLGIRTIAFPALGTGTARFPFQLAAETMTRTIADYLIGDTNLQLVIITLFSREGVKEDELNIFYEHVVANASLYTQTKRLNSLIMELKHFTDSPNNTEISKMIENLLYKLKNTQNILSEKPEDLKRLKEINRNSEINEIGNKVVQVTDTITSSWDHSKADETILHTKITGLQTVINALISQLNQLEIEKASYGGIGVPPRLSKAIEDLRRDIEEKENQLKLVRTQLATLHNIS